MFKDQNDTFKYSFILFDVIISIASYSLAFLIRFLLLDPSLGDFAGLELVNYLYLGGLLASNQIVAFLIIDLYHPRRLQSFSEEVFSILVGVMLNLVVTLSMLFFFRSEGLSRSLVLTFAVVNVVLIAVTHVIIRKSIKRKFTNGKKIRTVMILGTGHPALRIKNLLMKNPIYGYSFLGFVSENGTKPGENEIVLGRMQDLKGLMDHHRPNVVVSALQEPSELSSEEILDLCDTYGSDLKIVPSFTHLITSHGRVETLDGTPIISIREVPAREGFNRILKRAFDIVVSGLFLAVFSWLFLLIALIIKITSKGPVFFKQERVGLDGQKFNMLKFRSMYLQPPEASNTVWTTKDDPRVTPIGRFIRKTSLDEIPQFINAFLGEMSVVGPRPERPFYVEQFKDEIKSYMRRHAVKAGITGWAQINGLRGDTSIADRIEADIYYIENWSFFLDLKIVILTPLKGILDKNAY